jgi:hypothetical protein
MGHRRGHRRDADHVSVTVPTSLPSSTRQLAGVAVLAAVALAVYEVASVWFIMPLPGSQRLRSLDVAYALHEWRWVVRLTLGTLWFAGLVTAWRGGRWCWSWPATRRASRRS